ncbi:MAG: hypothetical protein ACRD0V_05120 [Acidimicrobiales bacterium]
MHDRLPLAVFDGPRHHSTPAGWGRRARSTSTRDFVMAVGGRMAVDSPPGGGTSLLVTIPVDAG